jgi:hypothetical protein
LGRVVDARFLFQPQRIVNGLRPDVIVEVDIQISAASDL